MATPEVKRAALAIDARFIDFMRQNGITLLRFALGIVFLWFGLLKVIGQSPVEDLVKAMAFLIDGDVLVIIMGVWEMAVGLGLILNLAMRFTLLLFWLQMAATLLLLVVRPGITFQNNNPLLLTTEGEFVIKNIVLIASGLAIGSRIRKKTGQIDQFRQNSMNHKAS